MKLILALPAIGLLFSGLSIIPGTPSHSLQPTPATDNIPHLSMLWADKATCYKNETFQLHFSMPHAAALGVVDPEGKFFYLAFPAKSTIGKLKPLINSEEFVHCNSLNICPATLKADPYTYGVLENQPVFTKSGLYKFVLADNLHVDDEDALSIVAVQYYHESRTASFAMLGN